MTQIYKKVVKRPFKSQQIMKKKKKTKKIKKKITNIKK